MSAYKRSLYHRLHSLVTQVPGCRHWFLGIEHEQGEVIDHRGEREPNVEERWIDASNIVARRDRVTSGPEDVYRVPERVLEHVNPGPGDWRAAQKLNVYARKLVGDDIARAGSGEVDGDKSGAGRVRC